MDRDGIREAVALEGFVMRTGHSAPTPAPTPLIDAFVALYEAGPDSAHDGCHCAACEARDDVTALLDKEQAEVG